MLTIKNRFTDKIILEVETLKYADLRSANFRSANLRSANLEGANLECADLRSANLERANLEGADLECANLECANLEGADLRSANLERANLRSANLKAADLEGANLGHYSILPEGDIIGYKKLQNNIICKLKISSKTRRTCTLVGRKCRAESAEVLEGEGVSRFNNKVEYKIGSIVTPDSYCDDIRIECSNGIHFFITRKEAELYL